LQLFAQLCSLNTPASAKLAMPLQPHWPSLFCSLSPEAYLLTGKKFNVRSRSAPAERPLLPGLPAVLLSVKFYWPFSQIFRIFIYQTARLSFQETSGLFG
jgi:hypothetical protein